MWLLAPRFFQGETKVGKFQCQTKTLLGSEAAQHLAVRDGFLFPDSGPHSQNYNLQSRHNPAAAV